MPIVPTSLHRTIYLELEFYEDIITRMAKYEKSIGDLYGSLLDALGGGSVIVARKEEIREILGETKTGKFLSIIVVLIMLTGLGVFFYEMLMLGKDLLPYAFPALPLALLALVLYMEYKRREKLEKYLEGVGIKLDWRKYLIIIERALDIIEKIFETIEKRVGYKVYIANATRSGVVRLKAGLARVKTMQEQQMATTTYV